MTDRGIPDPFTSDPVAESSTHRRLPRATRQLVDLLNETKPLVELLNSPLTTHPYRATLGGRDDYFQLANRLQQTCSMAAWGAGALERAGGLAPPPHRPVPGMTASKAAPSSRSLAHPRVSFTARIPGQNQLLDERSTYMQIVLRWFPRWRELLTMLVALITVVLLASCGAASSRAITLAENQQILATCDPAAPPASFIQLDGTDLSNSAAIVEERMAAIEAIVRRTAVCSGHLKVLVFSVSSAATAVLFDGALHLDGATDNARLKRVPALVGEVMGEIEKGYEPAIAALPLGGSDVTAMYRLASEWIGQVGDSFRLCLYLFTDGVQNVGVDLGSRVLTDPEATALADTFDVPQLPGASVVVAGLGRVAGPPLPSALAEGLVSFYNALCKRADAADCLSVTDYSVGR